MFTFVLPLLCPFFWNRLQAIATPLVPNMEKVQIIPLPKDIDPRNLSWKGAAVLGKMDAVADFWVTDTDWVSLSLDNLLIFIISFMMAQCHVHALVPPFPFCRNRLRSINLHMLTLVTLLEISRIGSECVH